MTVGVGLLGRAIIRLVAEVELARMARPLHQIPPMVETVGPVLTIQLGPQQLRQAIQVITLVAVVAQKWAQTLQGQVESAVAVTATMFLELMGKTVQQTPAEGAEAAEAVQAQIPVLAVQEL
jgi:uncharacterized membrane protein YfbV (UPF0208 family)